MTLKQLTGCNIYDENKLPIGQVREVMFDKKTGKCLLEIDGKAYYVDKLDDRDEYVVAHNLQEADEKRPTILDKAVYDVLGRQLGTASDGIVNKTATLCKLILDNGKQFSKGRIACADDIILIKAPKPSKSKPKQKKEHMQICTNAQPTENTVKTPSAMRRRYGDFTFLIGKTADKNIVNFYGEIMIHRGDKVTAETLRQAKISGKLIELCLHAK